MKFMLVLSNLVSWCVKCVLLMLGGLSSSSGVIFSVLLLLLYSVIWWCMLFRVLWKLGSLL